MATAVIMPKQGQSVETCIITKWFKTKGESVSAGDILFSYETDKAAFDLESPADGILLDIFFPEGSEVPVLVNVAVIGKAGNQQLLLIRDSQLSQYLHASCSRNLKAKCSCSQRFLNLKSLLHHQIPESGFLPGQNDWQKKKGLTTAI